MLNLEDLRLREDEIVARHFPDMLSADAQFTKLAWGIVDWLEDTNSGDFDGSEGPDYWGGISDVAMKLKSKLLDLGVERPALSLQGSEDG